MPEYTVKTAPDPISKIRAALEHVKFLEEMRSKGKVADTRHSVLSMQHIVFQNVPALLARLDELEAENRTLKEQLDIQDNTFGE